MSVLLAKTMPLLINSLLAFVSLSVCILLLEVSVRVALPEYSPSDNFSLYIDPATGITLPKKNTRIRHNSRTGDWDLWVDINKYGFRDKKDWATSRPGDFFVVGDSFSFGWGVEESERYSNLLETALGKRVFNISLPEDLDGYARYIRYAQENGATIDSLIVGICMENDIVDYRLEASKTWAPGASGHAFKFYNIREFNDIKSFLETRSAAYVAATTMISQNKLLVEVFTRLGLKSEYAPEEQKRSYASERVKQSIRRTKELVEPFRAVIVIIPSRFLWVGQYQDTANRIHNEYVDGLRQAGLDVIDVRAAFEEGRDPMQYHFVKNGHWNRTGHRKAAEVIAAFLQARESVARQ